MAGSKQGKAGPPSHPGWAGAVEQLLGSLASRLTMVIAIGCVCSCAYVVLLLITTHPCWSYGSSLCGNAGCSSLNNNSYSPDSLVTTSAQDDLLANGSSSDALIKGIRPITKNPTATSIDRIVFGIGASASLWSNRSQFLNLWWEKGETRGFVWFDRDLGDSWTENDPPYKVSADTSQFKYTHKTGHRAAIRISRIVCESFRLGLPDVDWFVMGDDDTFFFTENLVRVLSKYDPKKLWYIGSNSEDHIQNQLFSYNMAYGGGGFAISWPLAKLLSETQDACIHRYPWLFGSDDRMKACMSELGVPLTKEPGFHQLDIRGDIHGLLSAHPMSPMISLHHLEAIYPIFPKFSRAGALAHLLKAVDLSPYNILQQSICYDEEKLWSFSITWGYVVHVYKGFIAPNTLEVPTLTFLSWHKRREPYAFPINTRGRERDICDEPSSYYMSEAKVSKKSGGLAETTYKNGDRLNRIRVCQQRLLPMSRVQRMIVESEPLGEDWFENPRRQCCRITDVKADSININVGACKEGEVLVS